MSFRKSRNIDPMAYQSLKSSPCPRGPRMTFNGCDNILIPHGVKPARNLARFCKALGLPSFN